MLIKWTQIKVLVFDQHDVIVFWPQGIRVLCVKRIWNGNFYRTSGEVGRSEWWRKSCLKTHYVYVIIIYTYILQTKVLFHILHDNYSCWVSPVWRPIPVCTAYQFVGLMYCRWCTNYATTESPSASIRALHPSIPSLPLICHWLKVDWVHSQLIYMHRYSQVFVL